MAETKEYLDYNGLSEYHKKSKGLFQDLTIQDVEEAFNELDESDPSYSAFYDVIQKAKEATANADSKAAAAVTATNNANTATSNADKATERANKAAEKLETVNDITTIPNLLRGTRDITIGTNKLNTYICSDGFFLQANPNVYIDDDGYSVVHCTTGQQSAWTSHIPGLSKGDKVTVSINVMFDSVSSLSNQALFRFSVRNKDWSTAKQDVLYRVGDLVSTYGTIEAGKWYQIILHASVTVDLEEEDLCFVYTGTDTNLISNGVRFKLFYACSGHIEHLEWSASPFDVASSYGNPCYLGVLPTSNIIKENDNLNSYTTPGVYGSLAAVAVTLENCPTTTAFKLHVENINGSSNSGLFQHIEDANYVTWTRLTSTGGSSWNPWHQTYANSAVRPIEGGGTGNTYGGADRLINKTVGQDANLNDLRVDGHYIVQNTSIASSLKHSPFASIFGMDIHTILGSGNVATYLYQMACCYFDGSFSDNSPRIGKLAYRTRSNDNINSSSSTNGWSQWGYIFSSESCIPHVSGAYIGVNLETKYKDEIDTQHPATWFQNRVKAGRFEGLNIGDYFDISCDGVVMRYRIGAVDPYYKCGDSQKGHHVIMIPDTPWTLSAAKDGAYAINTNCLYWNTTADNNGTDSEWHPYLASNLHKWETEKMLPRFPQEWQDAMLVQRVVLEERFSSSSKLTSSNKYSWANIGKIWSPSETEVYGQCVWGTKGYSVGADCQFPIFRLSKDRIKNRAIWWLRTTVSDATLSTSVCCVNANGLADFAQTIHTGVRPLPCFAVG